MRFEWPTALSASDMRDLVLLMNEVAVRERTLGFDEPLGEGEGRELMQAFDAGLRRGDHEVLLARSENGRVVGSVTLARQVLPARRHIVEMRRCVIDPAHRGQFLLDGWGHAVGKAHAMGCDVIVLEVREDGPVGLWLRLGFRQYGRLPDYARRGSDPVVGYFMHARVPDLLAHRKATGSWVHRPDDAVRPTLASAGTGAS